MLRPRLIWLSAVPFAVALAAFAHPGGLRASLHDVWNSLDSDAACRTEATERERLRAVSRGMLIRQELRAAVLSDLIAGRIELADAVQRFDAINADDPVIRDALRRRFGDRPSDEWTARSVVSHLEVRPGGTEAMARVQRQFEGMFSRPLGEP